MTSRAPLLARMRKNGFRPYLPITITAAMAATALATLTTEPAEEPSSATPVARSGRMARSGTIARSWNNKIANDF
jgi:hypothetical protein